jgi:hypothetical protein
LVPSAPEYRIDPRQQERVALHTAPESPKNLDENTPPDE